MALELLGIVFGGVSRLAQHWLDLKDKEKERGHEAVMFDKQIALADRRAEQQLALKGIEGEIQSESNEWTAIEAGIKAQALEAASAGSFIASLSASVRPVLSYWIVAIYSTVKFCTLYLALTTQGLSFTSVVPTLYTEFDGAMLGSILGFYFADRSLRKR